MVFDNKSSTVVISDEDFLKFREFFYRKTGIFIEDSKRYYVDKRLIERIEKTESASFREYFMLVRFQATGEELQSLINIMTVNETYFFREEYQFRCLVDDILTERIKSKRAGDSVKVWSLPCSTGEEIYSIAIYILEKWKYSNDYDIELFGSDIDSTVLNSAKKGLYGRRSVQGLPQMYLDKYFKKVGENYQITSDLSDAIDFSLANIVENKNLNRFKNLDVIFCRNLLIYFDDYSRRLAAETIYEALAPGGFICLGHSESMSRISELFKVRKFPQAIVYQKPY